MGTAAVHSASLEESTATSMSESDAEHLPPVIQVYEYTPTDNGGYKYK